ncbi:MAG: molybdopterin-dependent oxidoreductase, partial [Anaerolineae bacterium]|nr:molybdopterin-dependent oxidoreductase [Anaerolineae bacterium]
HPALSAWGGCRMCLVEVAKQRTLQPACTFPVSEGLEVWTESEKVVKTRKFVLELLFSERNHYCMYCQMSGDCELQDLAYRYQLDHWTYNRTYEPKPVDATRSYFVYEPNRCILCRRCVRACSEIAANHTLGLKFRGANSMIIADHDVPFGESTCVECGTCLQVCPTGALIDRKSAYRYRHKGDVQKVATTCMQCSVGCAMEAVTHDNMVIRVEGAWHQGPSGGLLCVDGRFRPLYDTRARITSPMVRRDGALQPASWDEALQLIAGKLKAGGALGVAASCTTNEALRAFAGLFAKAGGRAGRAEPALPAIPGARPALVSDVASADLIVVAGADPLEQNRVVGYFAKRAFDKGARLVLIGDSPNGMAAYAHSVFAEDEADKAAALAAGAEKPVVIYGVGTSDKVRKALGTLADKALFLGLEPGPNGRGALQAGLTPVSAGGAAVVFLLAGDAPEVRTEELAGFLNGGFTVVQASRQSALTERADVVLPAPIWAEQNGHVTNLEGKELVVQAAVQMPAGVRSEVEVLQTLAGLL